jgi:lysophospholipase L1-like esterase
MKTRNLLYILPLAALTACEPDIEDVNFSDTRGSADFSRTVSVGNSLTAGYQSSALRRNKQVNSFPAILGQQFQRVGGGEFTQPLLAEGVGTSVTGVAELGLAIGIDCQGTPGPAPKPIAENGQASELTNSVGAAGPYNNVGVPGAKSFHLTLAGYGALNPYFGRFADPSNPNETMIEHAMRSNPTFFTLFIGNNDVLGYATSGGSGNPNGGTGSNDITDQGTFTAVYTGMVSALTAGGAKGAVANIPNITSIPFFTTVPIGTNAVTEANAAALNSAQAYGRYNAGLDQVAADTSNPFTKAFTQAMADARKIRFTGGQINTFVVLDPSLTDLTAVNPGLISMRQARPGELMTLTLPGDSLRCGGWGTAKPIPPQYHLTATEISNIKTATDGYNTTIKSLADANGLAFVDAAARLAQLSNGGINVDGTLYTGTFGTGGAFSFDGVHPSTRGYAILANSFIDAINATYSATIEKVDVNSYPTLD